MDLGWLWWVTLRSSLVKQTNKQKITFLLSDVDNGRGYACVGVKNIWRISVFSSQYFCKPETSLKKVSKKKKKEKKKSHSTLEGK